MSQSERPIIDRVWEFTKDISVKVSKQAEKHWKINTLRVEIASIKHKKNNSCRELGKFVYDALLSNTVEEDSYKTSLEGFFVELQNLDHEILERERRIEILAAEPDPTTDEDSEEIPVDTKTDVVEPQQEDAVIEEKEDTVSTDEETTEEKTKEEKSD